MSDTAEIVDTTSDSAAAPELKVEGVDFFYVWTKSGRTPRYAWTTQAEAEGEAERLARQHPGRKYIVLRAVAKFSVAGESAGKMNRIWHEKAAVHYKSLTGLREIADRLEGGASLSDLGVDLTPDALAHLIRGAVGRARPVVGPAAAEIT